MLFCAGNIVDDGVTVIRIFLVDPVCSLRSAVCGLRSAVCGLQSAVCSLQSAVCKCHTPVVPFFSSPQSTLVNNHQVPAHNPYVLSSLPSLLYVPFYLTSRAGFTTDMLTQISSLVDSGVSFHSVQSVSSALSETSMPLYGSLCAWCQLFVFS